MAEINERMAVLETEIKRIRQDVEKMVDMHLTMDAVVRELRKHSELIESEEFIKDRIYLQKIRANAESNANKVRLTVVGVLATGALTALWLGVVEYIEKVLAK